MDTENESLRPDGEVTDEMIKAGINAFDLTVDPSDPFALADRLVAAVYTAMDRAKVYRERNLNLRAPESSADC